MITQLKFALFALLALPVSLVQAQDCAAQFVGGQSPLINDQRFTARSQTLCFEEYAVFHSGVTLTPLWSAEFLTKNRIGEAKKLKRFDQFHEEERLPPSERANLKDYRASGYDRGHMSPNKDFSTYSAQTESFSLSNIIPQNPDNNQNLWEGIESATRAMVSQRGKLYVVTGPIFEGTTRRLKSRVAVPTGLYKAIYDPVRKEGGAYLADNVEGMAYRSISLKELEQITGINHFPAVPDSVKAQPMRLPEPTPHGNKYRNGDTSYASQAPRAHQAQQAQDETTDIMRRLAKTFRHFAH